MNKLISRYRPALLEICAKHNLLLEEVLSTRRDKYIRDGRIECYAFLRNQGITYVSIAKAFNRTHGAVLYSFKNHCYYKELLKY